MLAPKSNLPGRFYGLPKIHKPDIPIRPIVDYTSCATYQLAKYLKTKLKPLQKLVVSRLQNSLEFVDIMNEVTIEPHETHVSFDVVALYTSVPIKESLDYIHSMLNEEFSLLSATELDSTEIINGLELCLTSTYFTFNGDLYRQTNGVAMGSPISPIVADLFLHHV